jgi:ABC-type polysaccharide/polyol phosphate export permease
MRYDLSRRPAPNTLAQTQFLEAEAANEDRGQALATLVRPFQVIWRRRELLAHLTVRNLRVQYKQSALGYSWLFVNPVSQMLTLTFIFSAVFKTPSQGSPFVLFLCIGLFPWIFFAAALQSATESIVASAPLINTIRFPRELLVISAVLIRLVDFCAALVVLAVALIYYSQPLTLSAFWVLPMFFLQFVFTLGLAFPLAALNLFFHDVRYLVGVVLYLWFFFTPVFYSTDIVPARYTTLFNLNPMSRFINAYRFSILHDGSPPAVSLGIAAAMAFSTLIVGYLIFRKLEPRFADRV